MLRFLYFFDFFDFAVKFKACDLVFTSYQKTGRVEPGSCPPGAPTDPDVPNFRTAGPRHPVPLEKDSHE
jgi:hypothetical protein